MCTRTHARARSSHLVPAVAFSGRRSNRPPPPSPMQIRGRRSGDNPKCGDSRISLTFGQIETETFDLGPHPYSTTDSHRPGNSIQWTLDLACSPFSNGPCKKLLTAFQCAPRDAYALELAHPSRSEPKKRLNSRTISSARVRFKCGIRGGMVAILEEIDVIPISWACGSITQHLNLKAETYM